MIAEGEIREVSKPNEEVSSGSNSKLIGWGSLSCRNMLGKRSGNFTSKDMFVRADKVDLKSLDVQLESHLSRGWLKNSEAAKPKEEWEIDPSKLHIRYLVAQGTYGTVYRGTYDTRDVAGITLLHVYFYESNICFVVYFVCRKMDEI